MAFNKPRSEPPPQPLGEKKPGVVAVEAKQKPKTTRSKEASSWSWGPGARILVSALVSFHLLIVFAAPWAIQLESSVMPMVEPEGTPRDEQGRPIPPEQLGLREYPMQLPVVPLGLMRLFHHYANLLYINNGYDFFSPNPGVSHLIRYEVYNDAGEKLADGEFPNRQQQWPRLFYHRHMMLVEQSRDPRAGQGWEFHIAERLLEKHDGDRVRLTMVRHHLLTPQQVLAGERIDAPSTYEEIGVMEHRRTRPRPSAGQLPPGGTP